MSLQAGSPPPASSGPAPSTLRRQLVADIASALGVVSPYVVQLATGALGWVDATSMSVGSLVAFYLGHQHVRASEASAVAAQVTAWLRRTL